ncbi:MAG: hypothetical protein HC921_22305 [Synechococcaceae cyanobacterium SM2_3_1]|nr:hypothetical protein [Synechococcaceae cyanobacterium SM2_3_1]
MTDEELNDRFAQMADAVGKIADAQLGTQKQIGLLSDLMQHVIERQEQQEQEIQEIRQRQLHHDEEMEKFHQRQEESDQRFNILLEEIRFLIRQQRPQEDQE